MKRLIIIMIIALGLQAHAQKSLTWFDLSVGISWDPNASTFGFREAQFSSEMLALEGKQVIMTGYFLTLGKNQPMSLLSKNPMASCFFCGASGPETVVELLFNKPPSYAVDDVISAKGILRLNRDDPNHCYYRIEEVEAISIK